MNIAQLKDVKLPSENNYKPKTTPVNDIQVVHKICKDKRPSHSYYQSTNYCHNNIVVVKSVTTCSNDISSTTDNQMVIDNPNIFQSFNPRNIFNSKCYVADRKLENASNHLHTSQIRDSKPNTTSVGNSSKTNNPILGYKQPHIITQKQILSEVSAVNNITSTPLICPYTSTPISKPIVIQSNQLHVPTSKINNIPKMQNIIQLSPTSYASGIQTKCVIADTTNASTTSSNSNTRSVVTPIPLCHSKKRIRSLPVLFQSQKKVKSIEPSISNNASTSNENLHDPGQINLFIDDLINEVTIDMFKEIIEYTRVFMVQVWEDKAKVGLSTTKNKKKSKLSNKGNIDFQFYISINHY